MAEGIDPALQTAALAALEAGLNRTLNLAPMALEQLKTQQGNVFALHCTAPAVNAFLHITEQGIRLAGVHEGDVTTSITGKAADFQALATSSDPTATLINGGLELEGDSAPLIELQKVLSGLDMDWEAPLVDTLGDVVGHQIARLLRHAFSWGQQASRSLERQLGEFIHEEARLTPPQLELEDFYSDVKTLVQRVERAQSRMQRLQSRIAKLQE
ncbi:MAG: SCP2 domain-containing protein [Halioglobus sp.]